MKEEAFKQEQKRLQNSEFGGSKTCKSGKNGKNGKNCKMVRKEQEIER